MAGHDAISSVENEIDVQPCLKQRRLELSGCAEGAQVALAPTPAPARPQVREENESAEDAGLMSARCTSAHKAPRRSPLAAQLLCHYGTLPAHGDDAHSLSSVEIIIITSFFLTVGVWRDWPICLGVV